MVAISSHSRALSAWGLLTGAGAALLAGCSAPPDTSDDDAMAVPPFMGGNVSGGIGSNLPAGGAGSQASNAPGATNPGSATPGQTSEGTPNSAPISNNTGMTPGNNLPSMGGAGAGGAPGAMAPGGGGNTGMPPQMGAAGAGMQPPVMQPPMMEPPFVGPGCDASAFFCEDFESFNTGALQANADFTPSTANGTLTIDATNARGQRALHVQTQGNGRAYIALNGFAPPNNSFFARMYVRVEAFPTAPNYAHFTLVEAAGMGAGLIRPIGGQRINEEGGTFWGPGSDGGPTGDWTNWQTSSPAVAGQYQCIEWEMNSASNAINIWINSQAQTALSVNTTSHGGANTDFVFPRFNNLWIGWQLYQGGPTPNQFNLWFDDIVLSTRRVGC